MAATALLDGTFKLPTPYQNTFFFADYGKAAM
jgi:hypothetical protein